MKSFTSLLPALGLFAAANAWANDWNQTVTTTTVTTDIYTTYCPEATTFTQGTKVSIVGSRATRRLLMIVRPTLLLLQRPSPSLTGKISASAAPQSLLTPPSSSPCTYVTTSKLPWGTGSSKPTTTSVPPPVWTTTTVTTDVYTTYCPVPTTVVQGSKVCSDASGDQTGC